MPAEQDFVELTALPFVIAQVVRGALEAEDIPTRVQREALSSVYGLDSGLFATRVMVPRADLPRARALLEEIEAEQLEG